MLYAVPIDRPGRKVTVAPSIPACFCLRPVRVSLVRGTMKDFDRLKVQIQRPICLRRGRDRRKTPRPGTGVALDPAAQGSPIVVRGIELVIVAGIEIQSDALLVEI